MALDCLRYWIASMKVLSLLLRNASTGDYWGADWQASMKVLSLLLRNVAGKSEYTSRCLPPQ